MQGAQLIRRHRTWSLSAGPLQFTSSRIDDLVAQAGPPLTGRPRPALVTVAGTVIAVIGGLTIAAIAVQGSSADATPPRYLLSVAIPEVKATPRQARRVAGPSLALRAASAESTPSSRPEPAPAAPEPEQSPGGDGVASLESRDRAVALALETGRLQQWTDADNGEHGFVVVGDADPADGRCRMMSVLVRRDGGDDVQRGRACPGRAALHEVPALADIGR